MTQRFYTNVQLIGNQFLVRGVENGKRFETRDEFFPTLFVKTKKESKHRTLSGEYVEPVNPGTVISKRLDINANLCESLLSNISLIGAEATLSCIDCVSGHKYIVDSE